jgi:outer membrane protein assembly factor BamA
MAHRTITGAGWIILGALSLILPMQVTAQAIGASPPETLQVQEVRCAGNEQTSCDFIRDHLHLKAGDTLDEDEIRNAELRLSALRNFDSVRIHLEKGARRGSVIVVVGVSENSPIAMESIAGVSSRLDSDRAVIGGRISHQNLFGEGKYAGLTAVALVPFSDVASDEAYEVALRYADPQLFGSRRWFAIAAAGWRKQDSEDVYGNFAHLDTPQFDLSVGWRFADFSYLTGSVNYRPGIDYLSGRWMQDGFFEIEDGDELELTFTFAYGWSSEDDLHFPTQGATFQLAVSEEGFGSGSLGRFSPLQFRKTWSWLDAYWTVKIGGEPNPEYHNTSAESQLFAFSYARPVKGGDNVRRGRWYIEPGISFPALTPEGDPIREVGLKIGYRADTRMFGIVDLYLIGSVEAKL